MKKGKVFGKSQLALAIMVVALGAAVWLNMKYSSANGIGTEANNSSKYLGQAEFVNGSNIVSSASSDGSAVETATTPTDDYFANARADRKKTREEAAELIEETLKDAKLDDAAKAAAVTKAAEIAERMEQEASAESLLKAKGFADAVVVIGDNDVNVIVKSDGLLSSQTMQIQDVITSQTGVELGKIKIVTVK